MTTCDPTLPLVGVKLAIAGNTRNGFRVFKTVVDVVTETVPVTAVAGTCTVREVLDCERRVAAPPLKETLVAAVNP